MAPGRAARTACTASRGSQLLQVRALHAGFLLQLAQRAGAQVFVLRHVHKAAGQRPLAGKGLGRIGRALHQQHLQVLLAVCRTAQGEYSHVHRYQRADDVLDGLHKLFFFNVRSVHGLCNT